MSEIGSSEPEASGMETTVTVVDGADGLTPDMLRSRKPTGAERYFGTRAQQEGFIEAYWEARRKIDQDSKELDR